MYLIGKGDDVMGPGTAMVQRIDWTRDQERQLMNGMRGRGPGLGCVGLGCAGLGSVPEFAADCRQMGRYKGMGCRYKECGLGLFDSMDFTTWGMPEWAVVALGGYMLMSTVFTTRRAARVVGRKVKRLRSRAVAA